MIDETHLNGTAAKQQGFVDHLVDEDSLRKLITDELGGKINLVYDYGQAPREEIDLSNPFAFLAAISKKPTPSGKPAIALVYADGVIVDGEGGQSMFSSENEIGSEAMRRALRAAGRDPTVKVVVLRINSPGGSALASEVMWQAVRNVAKTKPVIVSVGGMAASGGYYLACSGDTIIADPSAIIGSIGVVGGKFVTKDLFAKIGLGTDTFKVGRNAGLYSSTEPWDDRQKREVRQWMQQTYDLFTQRVMQCRKDKIVDIDKVARGRIFTAEQAKEKGLIDQIGGLDQALTFAADKVHMQRGQYDVHVYPEPRTLADFFNGTADEPQTKLLLNPRIEINPDSILRAVSPEVSQLVAQQLEMVQLLQHRPYMLMSPYIMTTN
jgi:protease-4